MNFSLLPLRANPLVLSEWKTGEAPIALLSGYTDVANLKSSEVSAHTVIKENPVHIWMMS